MRSLLSTWHSSQQLQHFQKDYSSQKLSKAGLCFNVHSSLYFFYLEIHVTCKPYNVTPFHSRITEKNSVYSSKEVIEEADFCGLKYKLSGFPVSYSLLLVALHGQTDL